MASAFELTLDTQPPQPELATPVWEGDRLVVPYTIDEPAVVGAVFNSRPMTIEGDRLYIDIRRQTGEVLVVTRDDVANQQEWRLLIGIEVPELPGFRGLQAELDAIRRDVIQFELDDAELDRIRRENPWLSDEELDRIRREAQE